MHAHFGKIARFQEAGLWELHEESYYTEGKYLTFNAVPPPSILGDGRHIEKHYRALLFYYLSLRNAFAVAQALGRYCGQLAHNVSGISMHDAEL